jgi:hypothetical protein
MMKTLYNSGFMLLLLYAVLIWPRLVVILL